MPSVLWTSLKFIDYITGNEAKFLENKVKNTISRTFQVEQLI